MSIIHRSRSIGIDWLADGPIGPYVHAFKQYLTECRYATSTCAAYLAGITHFARWARSRRLRLHRIDEGSISEIIGARVADVVLEGCACVHLHGKGRKLRSIPLWGTTVVEIRAWLRRNPTLRGEAALLPNRDGQAMHRSNVAQRLALAVTRAAAEQPSLLKKRVSPHTLRHTSAMHLLQSGVPFNVIALWLGHESTTTTHRYVEADLAMKEKALARLEAPDTKMRRYRAPNALMRFPQTL